MKKQYLYIAINFFLFSSCSSQLDNVNPKNGILPEQLTTDDIGKLRNGLYAQMEQVMFNFAFDFDKRADHFRSGPGFSLVDPVNMTPSDDDVLTLWRSAYNRMADVNFLLETLETTGNTSATAQTIKGEALYFKACLYYNLVSRWGGVPIMNKRTFDAIPRSTEDDVWKQIISDLKVSESLLPDISNKFFVSKQAVQALLAKVFLATGDKTNAILYADLVINSNKFALTMDENGYASNFIANSVSKEIIFGFINTNVNNKKLYYQFVNDIDGTWNYAPDLKIFTSLYEDTPLKVGDIRKKAVFSSENTRIIKFPNGKSGQQLVTTTNPDQTPVIIARLPEMYLIKAEALGKVASNKSVLTIYLTARYSKPQSADLILGLSDIDFQNFILNEKQREFYGEGYFWYELKRTKRIDLLPSLKGRNQLLYYPIPQVEKDLGGYTQNQGY
jgi:starch-binding outer membrane protein, SusD/RagB family